MSVSSSVYPALFGYKAWANQELFALLQGLPPEQQPQLHSCIRILNHTYVVDRIFQAHLRKQPHAYQATNTEHTPDLAALARDVAELDQWFCQYVAGLDEDALAEPLSFYFTDGDAGTMSRQEILLHLISHGAYHRGNAGQMLKALQVAPPRDIFSRYLHQLEPARRQLGT